MSQQDGGDSALPRRFLSMLVGTASSGLGDGLVTTAFPLLMLSTTTNPLAVAGISAALNAPRVLLSLHGGALVDRSVLSRLLGWVDGGRFLCLAAMTALVAADVPTLTIPAIYLTAFVVGAGDVLVKAGVQRAIPMLVPDESLERANSLKHGAEDITDTMIGPALGGILYTIGAPIPFGVDGLTFLISAVVFLRVMPSADEILVPTDGALAQPDSLTAAAMEGVRWLNAQADLKVHVTVVAAFAMLQAGMIALLPLLPAAMAFQGRALGLLFASGSVAAVIASGLATRLIRGRSVSGVMTVAGVATGFAYLGLGVFDAFVLGLTFLAVEGFAVTVALIASVTWRQRRVPPELIGRVFSAVALFVGGAAVTGALIAGGIASFAGTTTTMVAVGVLQIVVPLALHPLSSRHLAATRNATRR